MKSLLRRQQNLEHSGAADAASSPIWGSPGYPANSSTGTISPLIVELSPSLDNHTAQTQTHISSTAKLLPPLYAIMGYLNKSISATHLLGCLHCHIPNLGIAPGDLLALHHYYQFLAPQQSVYVLHPAGQLLADLNQRSAFAVTCMPNLGSASLGSIRSTASPIPDHFGNSNPPH
ncbi:hypothetical protein [Pseudomonas amygdali]|uniref:hypothetical protein n=1 Tax=Pseudomonas amygdali TaxID=47877 RepID=UPI000A77AF61|nr:hypothetical protein [Pseudomonas amygdali]RMT08662.1 hypothetical protein ALP54_02318 [Pseudomonas amygdali pv. lachrymans]